MKKGPEHTTKYHIRHAQQLKQRRLRNYQIAIEKKNYNPQRLQERQYRKARATMERYWATLTWYQRLWIRIKALFKK